MRTAARLAGWGALALAAAACGETRSGDEIAARALGALDAFDARKDGAAAAQAPLATGEAEAAELARPVVFITQRAPDPTPRERAALAATEPAVVAVRGWRERLIGAPAERLTGVVLGGPEHLVVTLPPAENPAPDVPPVAEPLPSDALPLDSPAVVASPEAAPAPLAYTAGELDAVLAWRETHARAGLVLWSGAEALVRQPARLRGDSPAVGEELIAVQRRGDEPLAVAARVAARAVPLSLDEFDLERPDALIRLALPALPELVGAALIDEADRVAGIVLPRDDGGLAVALPSPLLAELAGRLTPERLAQAAPARADAERGVALGARVVELLSDDARLIGADVPPVGAVLAVRAGSPAEAAGLRKGDVLLRLDGRPLESLDEMTERLESHPAGRPLAITVLRDGRALELIALPPAAAR